MSQRSSAAWIAILAFILTLTALRFGPNLLRDDIYDSDATHHVFWTYKYSDPELFVDDFASEYFASEVVAPRGYDALYRILGQVLDQQIAAELVGAVLFIVALLLAVQLGRRLDNDDEAFGAWMMVIVLAIGIQELYLLPPMGLQRAFALPLTLWAALALVDRRLVQLGFVYLVAALFYPIVCATIGAATALILGWDLIRSRQLPRGWFWLGTLGVTALVLVALRQTPDGVGPMVTGSQALTMPEFGPDGRQKLFGEGIRGFLSYHRTGFGLPLPWLVATTFAVILLGLRKQLARIPSEIWVLTACAIAIWAIARSFMFILYLPARHASWVLPTFSAVCFAVLLSRPPLPDNWQRAFKRLVLAGGAILVVGSFAANAWQKVSSQPNADFEQVIAYLQSTPKNTLIASHPLDADPIPLRARRSVLVSRETSISFMLGYYERARERIAASLTAGYATRWDQVDALAERWGVDMFLVTPGMWKRDSYDAPFDRLVNELRQDPDGAFVLQNPPDSRVLFRAGNHILVRVGKSSSESQ